MQYNSKRGTIHGILHSFWISGYTPLSGLLTVSLGHSRTASTLLQSVITAAAPFLEPVWSNYCVASLHKSLQRGNASFEIHKTKHFCSAFFPFLYEGGGGESKGEASYQQSLNGLMVVLIHLGLCAASVLILFQTELSTPKTVFVFRLLRTLGAREAFLFFKGTHPKASQWLFFV